MKSVADIRQELTGKKLYQIAQLLLSDLVGYRKTSLSRTEDTDHVYHVLREVISLAKSGVISDE